MTRIEHGGAFVPVIQFRGNLPGLKKEPLALFSGRQSSLQFKSEQNCFSLEMCSTKVDNRNRRD